MIVGRFGGWGGLWEGDDDARIVMGGGLDDCQWEMVGRVWGIYD